MSLQIFSLEYDIGEYVFQELIGHYEKWGLKVYFKNSFHMGCFKNIWDLELQEGEGVIKGWTEFESKN